MGVASSTRHRIAAAVLALPLVAGSAVLLASSASAQAGSTVVAKASNVFDPASLTVAAGSTVTWTNEGGFHTVTGGDSAEDPSSPIGNNTLADASTTVKVTFDKPGTYKYFCQPHLSQGMKGEIVVTAAGAGGGGVPAPAPSAAPSAPPAATGNPSAAPSEAPADPGAGQSQSAGPGEESGDDAGSGIPGSTPEDNETLREIEEQRAAEEGTLGGYDALLTASLVALLALCVAVFASTRPRRTTTK